MNKNELHKMLMDNREEIIQKDKQDIPITKIAREYGVSFTTIYSLLRKWSKKRNVKRKYFKLPEDQKIDKEEKLIAFKKRIGPELSKKLEENSRINRKYSSRYPIKDS